MKGVVFTEFLEMVEERYSPEIADRIIEASRLDSGGIYTSVGTYDHREFFQLVAHLGHETETAVPELIRSFGEHLLHRFAVAYPHLFDGVGDTFALLKRIDDHIHVEVRKLYPDAELPRFEHEEPGPGRLNLFYRSKRPLADLAEGLIRGCAKHFEEEIDVRREDSSSADEARVTFRLEKRRA